MTNIRNNIQTPVPPHVIQEKPLVYTLDNILTQAYCQQLIATSENEHDYSLAQIQVRENQFRTDTSIRNNDRVIFDDTPLAQTLFELVKPHLPEVHDELWYLKGLNERFRFYRYGKGQKFRIHMDGAFKRHQYERSFLTLIFYLNDGFEGGGTTFFNYRGGVDQAATPKFVVEPRAGSALIFKHDQLHEGSEVTSGTKYVLRTDVMYHVPVE